MAYGRKKNFETADVTNPFQPWQMDLVSYPKKLALNNLNESCIALMTE
jgi:hypothetical protein